MRSSLLKSILFMPFFSLSFAWAQTCPTFQGEYECSSDKGDQGLTLKTEVVDGVYQYDLNTSTYIADSVVRESQNSQGANVKQMAECRQGALFTQMDMTIESDFCKGVLMPVHSESVFTGDIKSFVLDDLTILMCPNQKPFKIRSQYRCAKAR